MSFVDKFVQRSVAVAAADLFFYVEIFYLAARKEG